MSASNLLRVESQLEAYNRRDLSSFCQNFHPDVVMIRLTENKVVCRGMKEFRAIYLESFTINTLLHCELKSRIVLSEKIYDEEWVTGHESYPSGLHTVVIYAFRDGLIDRIWV